MKPRNFRSYLVCTLLGAALVFSSTAHSQTLIRVAGNFAGDHSSSIAMETFAQLVEERSGGAMRVQLFPNMQLGGAQENVDQVRSGAVQMTWIGIAFLSRLVPELEAVSLPFLFTSREQAMAVIDSEVGDMIDTALRSRDLASLGYMEMGPRHVTNNLRPIETIGDFQGMRIRLQPNQTHLETFRAIGANPVAMDISEVYSALQQGVLDGQENPYSINTTRSFFEVQRYLSDSNHFFDFIITVANANWLDRLPQDQREIVLEAMAETNLVQRGLAAAADEAALIRLQELGMIFTPIPDETRIALQEASSGVVDSLRVRLGDDLINTVLRIAEENR
jgi:tripartite ATP-independent transporter DctP family solute receptor